MPMRYEYEPACTSVVALKCCSQPPADTAGSARWSTTVAQWLQQRLSVVSPSWDGPSCLPITAARWPQLVRNIHGTHPCILKSKAVTPRHANSILAAAQPVTAAQPPSRVSPSCCIALHFAHLHTHSSDTCCCLLLPQLPIPVGGTSRVLGQSCVRQEDAMCSGL